MTFIENNSNSGTKNELVVQFPDSGLEFGSWRSFILKNITIDDINIKTEISTSISSPPPPPPPPSLSKAAVNSIKKDTIISPIPKAPTTPNTNDDFESFAVSVNPKSDNNLSGMNALEAAKARRETRNSETKSPSSRPLMSKLVASIPFYQSVKSTPKDSAEPTVFGNLMNDINNENDNDNDEKNNTKNDNMNDNTQVDESAEIDKNSNSTTKRNSTESKSR